MKNQTKHNLSKDCKRIIFDNISNNSKAIEFIRFLAIIGLGIGEV